jgi:hypothetical protein
MIGCPEMTVTIYQSTVHNVPEHRRFLIVGNELEWACGTRDIKTHKKPWSGNLKKTQYLGDSGTELRIKLKRIGMSPGFGWLRTGKSDGLF